MNYRSPHSSESVICAQPAGQSSLLVAVVMDVNFHCRLLAPNSPGFTTQNNALKSFILSPRTCKLHICPLYSSPPVSLSNFFQPGCDNSTRIKRAGSTGRGELIKVLFTFSINVSLFMQPGQNPFNKPKIKFECKVNPPKKKKNPCVRLELSFNLYFNVLFSNT